MKPIVIELPQNSPEWLAWRRDGIGASDAPVIEGVSPYKSPRQLFLEKSGADIVEDDSNEFIFAKGHKVEGLIRKEFQELVREEIQPVCLQHSKVDYFRASLDGFSESLGVLEAKLVGQAVLKTALEDGEIPLHHYVQMQHQFMVSGADVGRWFGHDGKKSGALVEVKADKEMIQRLADKEHVFWADLKANRIPALSDMDYLVPEDQSLLEELREAKIQAENAKIHFEAIREKATQTYGHSKISGAGLSLIRSVRAGPLSLTDIPEVKAAIDSAIAQLRKEYIESFRKKESEVWTVRIDAVRKAK